MLFDFDNKNRAQVKLGLVKIINKTTQERCHDCTSTHCVDGFEKMFNTIVILVLTTSLMGFSTAKTEGNINNSREILHTC